MTTQNLQIPQDDLKKVEKRARVKRVTGKTLTYFSLSVWAVLVLFPFYWMLLTSSRATAPIMRNIHRDSGRTRPRLPTIRQPLPRCRWPSTS